MKIFLIGIFGVLGVYSRYFLDSFFNSSLPYGTILSNIVGTLIAGICYCFISQKLNTHIYLPLLIGFCGGLTTFSSYMLQSFEMFNQGAIAKAFLYTGLMPVLGFLSVLISYQITFKLFFESH